MQPTYEMERNAPPAMSWGQYEQWLAPQWNALLESDPSEPEIQKFLEEHPSLLPGPFGQGFTSGHYPFYMAVVTQPALKGLTAFVPDFMWLASDSEFVYPVLIEIEAPTKRWFNQNGVSHHQLTAAIGQIKDWKAWFGQPTNQQWFLEYYDIGYPYRAGKALKPIYILIYGRRSEFDGKPQLGVKRGQLAAEQEFLMTFDRLSPSRDSEQLMSIKRPAQGGFEALCVPPTFSLGPVPARDRLPVRDKISAVERNTLISEERKAFLVRRIPYWDEWAESRGAGPMRPADME